MDYRPLVEGRIVNFWDKKNHETSWDKKITQPLGTKKYHATSWDKKILQPLGTKKKLCNFLGQINHKLQISTKVQKFNKRNLDVTIFGMLFVVCCSSQQCLQRVLTASSYYKSFSFNSLLTPDQTREGQRD